MIYDLVIVGSGPAGLAAASHAHANGMSYVLLERTDHLADTIYNYQARKFVMSEPTLIPGRGEVPFKAGSRESILDSWASHASERQLNIHFNAEVKSLNVAPPPPAAGSAAGGGGATFVNGERIVERRALADNDVVRFGRVILTFNVASEMRVGHTTSPQ